MAPAKSKKKKPALNPARGFATQSIASKPKTYDVEEKFRDTSANDTDSATSTTSSAIPSRPAHSQVTNGMSRPLHELSPEELEQRLEEANIQALMDKYRSKIARESARYLTKVQTDCRLLRNQAQDLHARHFLSEHLSRDALDLAAEEIDQGRHYLVDAKASPARLPEDDMIYKLWVLNRSLSSLGFSSDQIEIVLKYILDHPPVAETDSSAGVWGIDQCLDQIALNLVEDRLPVYDTETGRPFEIRKYETALEVSKKEQVQEQLPLNTEVSASEVLPDSKEAFSLQGSTMEHEDDDISDLESDLDPDESLNIWLNTKIALFQMDPSLAETLRNPFKASKKSTLRLKKGGFSQASTKAQKLAEKLQKIESDVLFDQHEADARWTRQRIELVKNATRKPKVEGMRAAEQELSDEVRSASDPDQVLEEGDDNALENLFSSIPHDHPSEDKAVPPDYSDGSERLCIRDFGTSKGVGPRRVLGEACLARDSDVKISFELVSVTAFANRHKVTIVWSRDYPRHFPLGSDEASCECILKGRLASFTMQTIATPDAQQSESYVAVVALFELFATSPKEEKAHLRLSPNWRDLWTELSNQYQTKIEAGEKQSLRHLRDVIRNHRANSSDEDLVLTNNFKRRNDDKQQAEHNESSTKEGLQHSPEMLKSLWQKKLLSNAYQKMLQGRSNLPMWQFKDQALDAIEGHQVTIICGETGCGKSTQLPAYILEKNLSNGKDCKIYCTEPRRISAITLAQRVSDELGEAKRDLGTIRSMIGFAIRLESQVSESTRLVYATTGIVLRMLESKNALTRITHIVVDEVHERSIETDFLLIILKTLIRQRPDLKVILMSATVDTERFSNYFGGAPVLNVPGRTFPVQTKFLEDAVELTGHVVDEDSHYMDQDKDFDYNHGDDAPNDSADAKSYSLRTRNTLSKMDPYSIDYTLLTRLIETLASNADYSAFGKVILVFLPGLAEIRRMDDTLSGSRVHNKYQIHCLHSSVASEEQQRAFAPPPTGMGKIILSTNIAETGVTIPDVTAVIDTGKHKEMRFDERRQISRLIESFISRANAKQRRGRAGRVQEGLCFHLFTRHRHDATMSDQQTPEMLRLSLQDLIMRVKICKLGDIQSTLAEAIDPPSAKNIRRAIDALIEVGALSNQEELTPIGIRLSSLPLDPYLGKLVLFGAIFGCLDVTVTLAAILTSKSPFITPVNARKQGDLARLAFRKGDSDLFTEFNAYCAWRRVCIQKTAPEFQYCRKNLLNSQTLFNVEDLKSQLMLAAADAGFVALSHSDRSDLSRVQNSSSHHRRFVFIPPKLDTNGSNSELVSAVIAWSLYPKLLGRHGNSWCNIGTNQAISLHPTSILRLSPGPSAHSIKFLSFYSILQSSASKNYNANSLSPVSPLPLVLLAGNSVNFHNIAHVISIDGARLRFSLVDYTRTGQSPKTSQAGWKTFLAIKYLRRRLEEIVRWKWKNPSQSLPLQLQKWMDLLSCVFDSWAPKDES